MGPLRCRMLAVRKRWQSTRDESDVARSTPRETTQMRCCSRLVSSFRLTFCRPPLIRGMGLAVRCVQEMLFKKAAAPEPCDEAPCGTGMAYLQPTYKRTADIVHRAEYGTAQGDDIGTNKVFGVHSIFHPAPAKPHHFH